MEKTLLFVSRPSVFPKLELFLVDGLPLGMRQIYLCLGPRYFTVVVVFGLIFRDPDKDYL